MLNEECYIETKNAFIKYMEATEGPYEITVSQVLMIFDFEKWTYDPFNTSYDIRERLVNEFCPIQLEVDKDFIIEKINIIDDNKNFIYAEGAYLALYLSDDKIAAMLRLAYMKFLLSSMMFIFSMLKS